MRQSGATIWTRSRAEKFRQLTDSPAEDYHLYFYNPSVTPDGNYLIFISERTGLSNLFRLDLRSGEILQLTDAEPVRAEYRPFTEAVTGVGSCLPAIGNRGQEVFYFEGTDLFAVDIESLKQRQLFSLSTDRRPLCFRQIQMVTHWFLQPGTRPYSWNAHNACTLVKSSLMNNFSRNNQHDPARGRHHRRGRRTVVQRKVLDQPCACQPTESRSHFILP